MLGYISDLSLSYYVFLASPEAINQGADIALTVYGVVGSVLVAALSWLGKKLNDLIKAKISNELISGTLTRLTSSINDAVAMVDQTIREEIKAAKDENSPGGSAITKEEAQKLKSAVWDELKKEYGGMDGISKLLGVIGISDKQAIESKVDTMIEATVNSQKALKKKVQ